ncbi:MAG: NAD-binding protein, partial [Pseudonocardiaceae bacterium]
AMGRADYAPSFAVDGLSKDLQLMRDAVAPTEFSDGLLAQVHALYRQASEAGHGADDIAAVRTVFGT